MWPVLLSSLAALGCHTRLSPHSTILTPGTFVFRNPDALCRGVHKKGFTFAAVIVRPNYETGRQDPAIPPATIGLFELDRFEDDEPKMARLIMREVIVHGRRIQVSGARANADVTSFSMLPQTDTLRLPTCIPSGAVFVGETTRDVIAR